MTKTAELVVRASEVPEVAAVINAAARYRHHQELGETIPRHDAWRDLCRALDDLGVNLGPNNPRADIRTGRGWQWWQQPGALEGKTW